MADAPNTNKVDMSAIAFDLAKNAGWNDERGFKQFEKDFVKKFYEVIGLSDIPDEFLNFTKFIDAYSGVLVKSVQNDLAIMNLTKRLAMFKLSENIAQTEDKKPEDGGNAGTETPPPPTEAPGSAPTGFDPMAAK
jgi:hypothetical protein